MDETRYYLYDGHGSVRALVDENGVVTDTYDYDTFGNLISKTGYTENNYLYCGEQFDANTGFYYLRARYMNPSTGTFISMDTYQGSMFDPVTLHKYLYANANPVMNIDPSGYFSISELMGSINIMGCLESICVNSMAGAMFGSFFNSLFVELRGGTEYEIQQAFEQGFISGAFFGGLLGGLSFLASSFILAKVVLSGFEFYFANQAFQMAAIDFENGDYAVGVCETILGSFSLFSSANNFAGAYNSAANPARSYTPENWIESSDKIPQGKDYIAPDGTIYSSSKDYNIYDPNSRDWLSIHNNHSHGGIKPHTQYPETNISPTGITSKVKRTSETTFGDYELLDYALKFLGWLLK